VPAERRRILMLTCTTWKARALSPEQFDRMMAVWGKMEADEAANPNSERLCWFIYGDGSGGFTVSRHTDADEAMKFGLELSLALGEFLELDARPVLDLDTALPAITAALGRVHA
jgi:hypothetical protein